MKCRSLIGSAVGRSGCAFRLPFPSRRLYREHTLFIFAHPKEACHRPATNRAVGHAFILELAFPLIHLEQLARRKLYPAGTPVQLAPPTIIVFLDTGRQLRGIKGGTRRRHLFDLVMEAALGSSILSEMRGESFAEILGSLRNAYKQSVAQKYDAPINYKVKKTGIYALDEIIGRHFQDTKTGGLSITGRCLPLVYKIASTLASAPNNKVIIIIDYEGSFRASGLTCSESDLEHIYVLRPAENTRDQLRDVIASTENYVVYNEEAKKSANRELWGTIVLGSTAGGDVTAGWKGWLRVDREEVRPFPPDISIEEALQQREERQRAVEASRWQVSSAWGGFFFS